MSEDSLEQRLSGLGRVAGHAWGRARDDLAGRAEAEGLIDVAFERHDSPLGSILLAATDVGVVRVGLPGVDEDEVLDDLAARISARVLRGPRPVVSRARHELDEYFAGRLHDFGVPLDWRLTTGFRREVLRATARIPYGQTASYRDMATEAGSPRAVRAAGSALATNPLAIVVPCHRVLRSDGTLGQYGGGVQAKALLLGLEGAV